MDGIKLAKEKYVEQLNNTENKEIMFENKKEVTIDDKKIVPLQKNSDIGQTDMYNQMSD
jgi:hypothetical protein